MDQSVLRSILNEEYPFSPCYSITYTPLASDRLRTASTCNLRPSLKFMARVHPQAPQGVPQLPYGKPYPWYHYKMAKVPNSGVDKVYYRCTTPLDHEAFWLANPRHVIMSAEDIEMETGWPIYPTPAPLLSPLGKLTPLRAFLETDWTDSTTRYSAGSPLALVSFRIPKESFGHLRALYVHRTRGHISP
jgi:hypothetical protein